MHTILFADDTTLLIKSDTASKAIYLFYLNHTQWYSRKHKNTID